MKLKRKRDGIYQQGAYLLTCSKLPAESCVLVQIAFVPLMVLGDTVVRTEPDALREMSL